MIFVEAGGLFRVAQKPRVCPAKTAGRDLSYTEFVDRLSRGM
jgi:hypothetical protein